jgi:hypothetical protein
VAAVTLALFLGAVSAATFASRRFAGAVRRAGGSVLTGDERRSLLSAQPSNAFFRLAQDDITATRELFSRQVDAYAERWRLLTWLALALAVIVFLGGDDVFGLLDRGDHTIDSQVILRLIAALGASFWAIQFISAFRPPYARSWLAICAIGIMGAVLFFLSIGTR